MIFNEHSELEGHHAYLSASRYHWTNYTLEKLDATYRTALAAQRGTDLHDFAMRAINLGIKMPRTRSTLNSYVNDAIGFRMKPEQVLYYSPNAFGTADAISFKDKLLRIHDLKTGVTKASMRQLEIYTAFFCLEYGYKPSQFKTELRIYQNDEVIVHHPEAPDIVPLIDTIVAFDKRIEDIRKEAN